MGALWGGIHAVFLIYLLPRCFSSASPPLYPVCPLGAARPRLTRRPVWTLAAATPTATVAAAMAAAGGGGSARGKGGGSHRATKPPTVTAEEEAIGDAVNAEGGELEAADAVGAKGGGGGGGGPAKRKRGRAEPLRVVAPRVTRATSSDRLSPGRVLPRSPGAAEESPRSPPRRGVRLKVSGLNPTGAA